MYIYIVCVYIKICTFHITVCTCVCVAYIHCKWFCKLYINILQDKISSQLHNNIPPQLEDYPDLKSANLRYTLQENITVTCQYYSTLKAYQYMLYQFLHSQDTNVSNGTTRSVMYLLQTAAESLQIIQVSHAIAYINFRRAS